MTYCNAIKYVFGKESHTVSWDIKFHLIDKVREMRTVAKDSTESYFKIKIEILKDNTTEIDLRIHFLYPTARCIRNILTLTLACNAYGYHVPGSETINTSKYRMITPNEWQCLGNLDKKKLVVYKCALGDYVSFNLKFEFRIIGTFYEKFRPANVKMFYNTDQFSDIVVQSSDGKEFKAHKLMLASASEVFKAHFVHNTKECDTNIVECHYDSDVVTVILSYIYDGDVPAINEISEIILSAADFYQLIELKAICERIISNNVTAQNVIRTLKLAYCHNAEFLKQSALEFIKSEPSDLFLKTEDWVNCESIPVLKMIVEYLKSPNEVMLVYHDITTVDTKA